MCGEKEPQKIKLNQEKRGRKTKKTEGKGSRERERKHHVSEFKGKSGECERCHFVKRVVVFWCNGEGENEPVIKKKTKKIREEVEEKRARVWDKESVCMCVRPRACARERRCVSIMHAWWREKKAEERKSTPSFKKEGKKRHVEKIKELFSPSTKRTSRLLRSYSLLLPAHCTAWCTLYRQSCCHRDCTPTKKEEEVVRSSRRTKAMGMAEVAC